MWRMRCPACKKVISLKAILCDTQFAQTTPHKFVAYCCPQCDAVLGPGPNPVDLKNDIIDQVVARLSQA